MLFGSLRIKAANVILAFGMSLNPMNCSETLQISRNSKCTFFGNFSSRNSGINFWKKWSYVKLYSEYVWKNINFSHDKGKGIIPYCSAQENRIKFKLKIMLK